MTQETQNKLLALAQHILSMADDDYLSGHPEWNEIVEEANAATKTEGYEVDDEDLADYDERRSNERRDFLLGA